MSDQTGRQARPAKEVLAEVMDPCRSKSEHEWVAARIELPEWLAEEKGLI